jgi:phage tail sheath gpL-like
MPWRVLILGHALPASASGAGAGTSSAGPGAGLSPARITSAAQAAKVFGPGSLLAAQARAWFAGNTTTEVHYLAVPESDGAPAKITLTFSGHVPGGGMVTLYVGFTRYRAYVPPAATAREVAQALYTAMNGGAWPAVLGEDDGPTLTIPAPHRGSYANGVMVRLGYYQDEAPPAGLSCSFSGPEPVEGSPTPDYEVSAGLAGVIAFHGENDPARPFQSLAIPGMMPSKPGLYGRMHDGAGSPDLLAVAAELDKETQYHLIVTPFMDAASLAVLKDVAEDRWQALVDMPSQIIAAQGGTHTALGELGDSHNSHHLTILNTGGPFTAQENNLLLYDGISTYYPGADGDCRIQRLITTYKVNAWGAEDMAYLDLNTPLTLTYLRYSYKVWMAKRFPRHKLADDGTNYGQGQAIVTPKVIKAETLAWFTEMEQLGRVENVEHFRKELIVERPPKDPCRLNVYLPPNLVNQLRVLAVQIGFRL